MTKKTKLDWKKEEVLFQQGTGPLSKDTCVLFTFKPIEDFSSCYLPKEFNWSHIVFIQPMELKVYDTLIDLYTLDWIKEFIKKNKESETFIPELEKLIVWTTTVFYSKNREFNSLFQGLQGDEYRQLFNNKVLYSHQQTNHKEVNMLHDGINLDMYGPREDRDDSQPFENPCHISTHDWDFNVLTKENKSKSLFCKCILRDMMTNTMWVFTLPKEYTESLSQLTDIVRKCGCENIASGNARELINEWCQKECKVTVGTHMTYNKTPSERFLKVEVKEEHEPFSVCNKYNYEITKRHDVVLSLGESIKLLCEICCHSDNENVQNEIDVMLKELSDIQTRNIQRCLALKNLGLLKTN